MRRACRQMKSAKYGPIGCWRRNRWPRSCRRRRCRHSVASASVGFRRCERAKSVVSEGLRGMSEMISPLPPSRGELPQAEGGPPLPRPAHRGALARRPPLCHSVTSPPARGGEIRSPLPPSRGELPQAEGGVPQPLNHSVSPYVIRKSSEPGTAASCTTA